MLRPGALFLATLVFSGISIAGTKMEKKAYAGWPNCVWLSNGKVDVVVTTDVGPRIIRYGFVGGQNLLNE